MKPRRRPRNDAGRPDAPVVPVEASALDRQVDSPDSMRALEALRAIQAQGSPMSTREIDGIIARTRRARSRAAE